MGSEAPPGICRGQTLKRTPLAILDAPLADDEDSRLAALEALCLLDTPPEPRFDRLTRIAAASLRVEFAAVSLIDRERQWFKSIDGLQIAETSRRISLCGHVVAQGDPEIIADACDHAQFADNPLVLGAPHIRFPYRRECEIDPFFRSFNLINRFAIDQSVMSTQAQYHKRLVQKTHPEKAE